MKQIISITLCLIFAKLCFGQLEYYYPKSKSDNIIRHTYFSLNYSEKYEQAEWTIYRTTKENIENGNIKRKDNFRPDPLVSTGSAESIDYSKSGYDRGHLVPAGDMKFSDIAMSETFFYSNMSPQHPSFNRGIWLRLEDLVRQWTLKFDSLYIISSGVLVDINENIGINEVGVPKYFYKIIFYKNKLNDFQTICFLIPNKGGEKDLFDYTITIDSLESLTGIDFFYKLNDNIESKFESIKNLKIWKANYTQEYKENTNPFKLENNPKKEVNNQSALRTNDKSVKNEIPLIDILNKKDFKEFQFLDSSIAKKIEENKPYRKIEDIKPFINDLNKYNQIIEILKSSN